MTFADPTNQAAVSQKRTVFVAGMLLIVTLGLAAGYVAVQGTALHEPRGWNVSFRPPKGFVLHQRAGDEPVQLLVFGGALESRRRADLIYWRSLAGATEDDALSWLIWYLTDTVPDRDEDRSTSLENVLTVETTLAGRPAYEYAARDGSVIARVMTEPDGQMYGVVLLLPHAEVLDAEARAAFDQACDAVVHRGQ